MEESFTHYLSWLGEGHLPINTDKALIKLSLSLNSNLKLRNRLFQPPIDPILSIDDPFQFSMKYFFVITVWQLKKRLLKFLVSWYIITKEHCPVLNSMVLNHKQSSIILFTEQPTEMCNDTGVWIDGLVECRYLERPSAFNIHKNPAGFCHKYFNKCCATCTRLKQVRCF